MYANLVAWVWFVDVGLVVCDLGLLVCLSIRIKTF